MHDTRREVLDLLTATGTATMIEFTALANVSLSEANYHAGVLEQDGEVEIVDTLSDRGVTVRVYAITTKGERQLDSLP